MITVRLIVILLPNVDHLRKVAVNPIRIKALHALEPAVEPAPDVNDQRLRMLAQHRVRPVVKDAGAHSHVVGEPARPALPADRKRFRRPDPLRGRILQNNALPAHFGFAVKRNKQGVVHFIHGRLHRV